MRLPNIPGFDQQAFEKYFKNTGMLFVGRIGSLAIKMIVSIMLARYLGRGNNGIINGGLAYIYFFSAIATLGLDQFIVKELHQFPDNRDQILGTSFWMKIMAGLCCVPIIYTAYLVYPAKGTPYNYILIFSTIGIIQAFTVIDAYFQSQVQSKYIMQVQIAGNLISAIIKLLLIYTKQPLIYFIYAYTFDFLLISVGYYFTYQRKQRSIFKWSFNYKLAVKLLKYSWPLIISGIMVSLYMKIDAIMLQNIAGVKEAGAYATVAQFSEAWNFIPAVIVTSLFPAILNAKRDDISRYKKRIQHLYDLMVYLSLPVAIIITFASPLIYKLLTPEYAYAAPTLSVHIWSGVFVFLGAASSQYLIAENFNKLTFIRTGFGAIVNIALNLILIPHMGMMGAAIATLVAYASATFFIIFIPKVSDQGVMMFKSLFLISLAQKIIKR
ncbi:O-antigen/teichoic acid export membrane protein [Mucilaginibacter frigoritolerans]|uniref:O-antigen/teichoic acid export membrane protein n=1 Tax=Mucilaginibacter frigoritolerans TaxID=652788 RepID=A0A562U231_9SPHI|nr:flippase [Mucilaginibacter frigoritolerans]TWI99895.1 O-antigen/teichoic acid export membrane protein [Mucilaginibacter frigoritolerans]